MIEYCAHRFCSVDNVRGVRSYLQILLVLVENCELFDRRCREEIDLYLYRKKYIHRAALCITLRYKMVFSSSLRMILVAVLDV